MAIVKLVSKFVLFFHSVFPDSVLVSGPNHSFGPIIGVGIVLGISCIKNLLQLLNMLCPFSARCPNTLISEEHPTKKELPTVNGLVLLLSNLIYLTKPAFLKETEVKANGLKSRTCSPLYERIGSLPNWKADTELLLMSKEVIVFRPCAN